MQKYAKICKNMQKICKKYAVLGGSMFLYICAKYALGTLLMSGTLVRRWVRLGGSNSELPRSVSVTVVARLLLSSESRQGLLPTAFWWLASRSGWDRQARRGGTRMALNLKLNVRSLSRRSAKRVQFATRDRTALLRCHSFWNIFLITRISCLHCKKGQIDAVEGGGSGVEAFRWRTPARWGTLWQNGNSLHFGIII